MTKQEINRKVAEKVMEFKAHHYGRVNHGCGDWSWAELGYYDEKECTLIIPRVDDWNPAERIDHAWMVVKKFEEFSVLKMEGKYKARCGSRYGKIADTAPMAICLAALEAVERQQEVQDIAASTLTHENKVQAVAKVLKE